MFDLFVNLFECILFTAFLYHCSSEHKKNSVAISVIFAFFMFGSMQLINQYSPSQGVLTFGYICLDILYLELTTYLPFEKKLLAAISLYTVTYITNIPFLLTCSRILFSKIDYYTMMELYAEPIVLFLQLSHVVIYYYLAKTIRKDMPLLSIRETYTTCFLLCLCIMMAISIEAIMLGNSGTDVYLLLEMYGVVFFCAGLIYLFRSVYQRKSQSRNWNLKYCAVNWLLMKKYWKLREKRIN